MIDFIRIRYSDKTALENHIVKSARFGQTFAKTEIHTKKNFYPMQTKLHGMEIIIRNDSAEVNGSLHKYWNEMIEGISQNYNDYCYSSLVSTIESLSESILDVNFEPISRLEVGINIELEENPSMLIKNNVIMFKELPFSRLERFGGSGLMKRFISTEFDIKIYDKGKQYKRLISILRIEVVIKGANALNRLKIQNLESLKDKEIYQGLFDEIIIRFDKLVILDNFSRISKKDRNLLYKYTNQIYWNYHISGTSYSNKSKQRKQFKLLMEKNNLLTKKQMVKDKLIEKFSYIMNN